MQGYAPDAPPVLPTILPAMRMLFSSTISTSYRMVLGAAGHELEFLHMYGPETQRNRHGFSEGVDLLLSRWRSSTEPRRNWRTGHSLVGNASAPELARVRQARFWLK